MNAAPLAQHLRHAARHRPSALALAAAGATWDYASLAAASTRLAQAWTGGEGPILGRGDSTDLALSFHGSSLAGRPFWPGGGDCPGNAPVDTALIIATSGSEGRAKAVPLTNGNLEAAAAASAARIPLAPGDLWLDCLPLNHIGGLAILWRCARAGAAVLLHDGFDAAAVRRDLEAQPVTHISLVPAMLAHLLDCDSRPPPRLRYALVGGAPLSRPLFERARCAGWPILPTYGMSESAAQVACWDPACPWHEGLVGSPLPGVEVAIAGDGRIRLRGPQVMVRYLGGGGVDDDGWFTTGDLGCLDEGGRLTILGRADDMLVSGGSNIHPLTVESCLAACPGVADVAVTGHPDPIWGDLVVALVVGDTDAESILAWGRERLPPPARPRRVLSLERLPRNAMGKIDRPALRRFAANLLP